MFFIKVALTCSIKPTDIPDKDWDRYSEFDSKKTIDNLAKAIKANGHDVEIYNVGKGIKEILDAQKDKIDIVFNVAEGLEGYDREALVPKICEELRIPFSASGSFTLINTLDKAKTKDILKQYGILSPNFQIFDKLNQDLVNHLKFPLIVKPLFEGSSKGVFNENLVSNNTELKNITKKLIEKYKQPVIVEEFIEGREFTVSVIGYDNPTILPIVEVKFDHLPKHIHPMDSYEAKWVYDNPKAKHDPLVCPAKIDDKLEFKIKMVALKTYKILDCKDWARIDIRLDKDGNPNVLEVNALPGFMKDPKENSRLPRAAYAAGWSYEKLIGEVLNSAIKRWNLK